MSTTHQTNERFRNIELQLLQLGNLNHLLRLRVDLLEKELDNHKKQIKQLKAKLDKVYP